MARILVTGATGYTGGWVARRLVASGHDVHCITRSGSADIGCTWHKYDGSIESLRASMSPAPDAIVHLAACVVVEHAPDQVDAMLDANIRLPLQLMEVAAEVGCDRFINTSSFWQHFDGTDEYDPVNLYAGMKQSVRDLGAYFAATRGMRLLDLVLYDIYGPADPRRKLLTLLSDLARSGGQLDMTGGEQELALVHVNDVAAAFETAVLQSATMPAGAVATYAVRGEVLTPRLLVARIETLIGQKLNISWGGRPYRSREVMKVWRGDILPGWIPSIELSDGLRTILAPAENRG